MTSEARKDTRTIEAHSGIKGDVQPQRRLDADARLYKPCEACGHRGYMHENAERQYETGDYGVAVFEAGDIVCEVDDCWPRCTWYEGNNW